MSGYLADPHIQTMVGSVVSFLGILATYLKTRTSNKKMDHVTVHVNGRMSSLMERNIQLSTLLSIHGIPIPPTIKEYDEGHS